MPELPEVETIKEGIKPHLMQQTINKVVIRHTQLRWPIDPKIATKIKNQNILQVTRRAKYLIITTTNGSLIIHLGMSGKLSIVEPRTKPQKHDHVDFVLANKIMRYHDPRRFGAILWTKDCPLQHKLLANLGPEPLSSQFTAKYLLQSASRRTLPAKQFIMDNKVVVGVGNIYASESLFIAKINPLTPTNELQSSCFKNLTTAIKQILRKAIKQGGTTLKDFYHADGSQGYFKQSLAVYDRYQEPCYSCDSKINKIVLGQRSTFFCPNCQPLLDSRS